jgi:hypothetical protein
VADRSPDLLVSCSSHGGRTSYNQKALNRIHRTLRVTPGMAVGISDHVWSIEEIVGLLDTASAVAA